MLGNECFLLDGGVLSGCQPPRWKHAFYSTFSSGLIPMGYALYISLVFVQVLPLICGRLLADLDSLHAETTKKIYILPDVLNSASEEPSTVPTLRLSTT